MHLVSLSIIRYKKRFIPFAVLAMALHHLPLWFNKRITFYKLMMIAERQFGGFELAVRGLWMLRDSAEAGG